MYKSEKQEIAELKEEVKEYKKALQYFINRVEEGSIRSKTTYKMYKDLIEKYK